MRIRAFNSYHHLKIKNQDKKWKLLPIKSHFMVLKLGT
jgi:hypothetical protein